MPASLPMCCEHCHKSPRCCHTACTTGTFYSFILGLLPAGWAAAPAACLHQKPILQFLSESIGPLPGNGGTQGILERSLKYLRRCLKHRSDPPCYSPRPSQPPVKEITLQSNASEWCVEHRGFSRGMHSGHKRHSRVRERYCCLVMLSAVRAPDPRAAPLAQGIHTWAKDLSTWCAKDSAAAPKVATSVQSPKFSCSCPGIFHSLPILMKHPQGLQHGTCWCSLETPGRDGVALWHHTGPHPLCLPYWWALLEEQQLFCGQGCWWHRTVNCNVMALNGTERLSLWARWLKRRCPYTYCVQVLRLVLRRLKWVFGCLNACLKIKI